MAPHHPPMLKDESDQDRIAKAFAMHSGGDHQDGQSEQQENQLISELEATLNEFVKNVSTILDQLKSTQATEQQEPPEPGTPMDEDTGSPSAQGFP